jgi:hypothetical protein
MAGLDGIERELDPDEPIDRNPYELPPEQLAGIPTVPSTLDDALDALDALESDHELLTKGDVFTDDLIATYIEFRRDQSDRTRTSSPCTSTDSRLAAATNAGRQCVARRVAEGGVRGSSARSGSATSRAERRMRAGPVGRADDDELMRAQVGDYGGSITRELSGPFKGASGDIRLVMRRPAAEVLHRVTR